MYILEPVLPTDPSSSRENFGSSGVLLTPGLEKVAGLGGKS
jgi:hypothetical protein